MHTDCLIQVLDVNDNKPVFVESINEEFKILPLVNERTQIGWFGAVDVDSGENATVVYSLKNTFNNLFEIDHKLSYVYLNLRNKQSMLESEYDLEVVARDSGEAAQQLQTSKHVRIHIDENYYKFKQSDNDKLELNVNNMITLNENTANGTFVARVKVVNSIEAVLDAKPADNKSIELEFRLLTSNDTFYIDRRTGEVRVSGPPFYLSAFFSV